MRLNKNRRGVTDLPIKLLVVSILLSVSIPIIAGAVESGERNMDLAQMEDEAVRIGNAIASAYYTSGSSERFVEVNIPDGCYIVAGGDGRDAYAMHLYRGGEEIGTHWMEKPLIPFAEEATIAGHCVLAVTADADGARVRAA